MATGKLENRVAIITGAANGCGRATVKLFIDEGASVVGADLDREAGEDLKAELNSPRFHFVHADVSKPNDVKTIIAETKARFDTIDILHNQAGSIIVKPLLEFTHEDYDFVMENNAKSVFLMTQGVLPEMLKQGQGIFINTSSVSASTVSPMEAVYCSSKAAVSQFTRAVAVEFRDRGIRANVICPGFVRTPLVDKQIPEQAKELGISEEDVVKTLTVNDVRDFHQRWLRPNNATIVVSGNITMPELIEKLEKRFDKWQKADVPKKVIPEVKTATATNKIFLIDRPESEQTLIVSGYLTKPYGQVDEAAIEQMNNVLGGDFTSRINLNIREDKHWSYGAGTFIQNTRGQRPYLVFTSVQTDKTKESVQEIVKEVNAFVGDKPMTQAEFDKTKQNTVLGMAGMWETNAAVNGSVRNVIKYGLKDDYWKTYTDRVQKLGLQDVQNVAKTIVQPGNLGWFMAGDAEKTLPGLQQLGMEVIQIDANGKVLSKKVKP